MNFRGIEICCPRCRADLSQRGSEALVCAACGVYPIIAGIPDLRINPDPYIGLEADREKGLRVAARSNDLSFSDLIDFYYSITPAVPPQRARQYKRGLMAAGARAEGSLTVWESQCNDGPASRFLEVGCGTAPLLAAAARRFQTVAGVDIAFRWLIAGKKRLIEAGLDVPLFCACAEALPFPAGSFHRVALDSTVEHVSSQPQAFSECARVLESGGYLFVATPNRYSLGPDPHLGVWAGGYLPARCLAAYARRQGAVPPKRNLLSAGTLSGAVRAAGFERPRVFPPRVAEDQRRHFSGPLRVLIGLYQLGVQLPLVPRILMRIGPLIHAVARKGGQPVTQWQ